MEPVVGGRRKRTHTEAFKAELVAKCREPGMSLSRVAVLNGVHPNLLRRWVNERGGFGGESRFR